jgi:tetratricopeptide (TPR) repeat protein
MIKAPPRIVPQHLSPSDYCRLAIQYYLMGWTRQSVKAGRLALQSRPSDLAGTPFGELSDEDFMRFRRMVEGLDAGASIGENVLGVSKTVTDIVQDGMDTTSALADELIGESKALKLIKFGFEESMRQFTKGVQEVVGEVIEQAVKVSQPPKPVPEGLTAQNYLDLSRQYLVFDWTEQARDALLKARELEGDNPKGALAWTLLRTHLPKQHLPFLAEEGLADARRKLQSGREEDAREVLEDLINRYPEMELCYCVLAGYELRAGHLERARQLLTTASELNPMYMKTWLLLSRVHAIGGSILEAQRALDRATDLDPDDFSIPHLRQLVSILSRL